MDFGSEFVYSYSDSEEEEISAEAIETGVDSAPEEARTFSAPRKKKSGKLRSMFASLFSPARSLTPSPSTSCEDVMDHAPHSSKAGQKWRCADTNVVVVKFDRLTEPSNMHTGDPIVCSGCQVMLSHISRITQNGQKKIWTCEFCKTKNKVEIVQEEMPSKEDVTYMLEPALVAAAGDGGASGKTESQESIVVFCIDYSGSMETIVASSGDELISRLDGVKRAVCHQLERLEDSSPGCRVAVVAFESSVKVIADGKNMLEHQVRHGIFNDKKKLLKVASGLSLPSRICDSRKILTQNVLRESIGGGTALGPGLLVSLGIARQMARSKVIICTDGEANEGLGSLDNQDAAYAFYTEVAGIAKESGVSVSVLTIAGTDCKLVELGRVAALTGGQVNIVDPEAATEEFGNILADVIIATHATARFFVHRDLYVRGETDRPSHALRDIGNVIRGTEISFEYGVRTKEKPKTNDGCQGAKRGDGGKEPEKEPVAEGPRSVPKDKPLIPENSARLPFQIQIRYTDSKGAKAVRVFTETKPITKDRKVAESRMNISILGTHAIRVAADKALNAQYMESRLTDFAYAGMFKRNAIESEHFKKGYDVYEQASQPVKVSVTCAQRAEARSNKSTVMDAEKMLQNMGTDEVRRQRRQMVNDKFAEECYQGMKVSSTQFAKTEAKPRSASPPQPTAATPPEELIDQSNANDEIYCF